MIRRKKKSPNIESLREEHIDNTTEQKKNESNISEVTKANN